MKQRTLRVLTFPGLRAHRMAKPVSVDGRFSTLDGLRGLASIVVVVAHLPKLWGPIEFSHGFLAVDLFFALSGFVLARTYEPRLAAGLTATKFMGLRWARLYPLYILGTLLGLLGRVIGVENYGELSPSGVLSALAAGLFMLPSPTWHEHVHLYPLNMPAWSLGIEMLLSLMFVMCWRLSRKTLLGLALVAFGGVLCVRMLLGTHDTGHSWESWWGALPRGVFSFVVGMLLSRTLTGPRRESRWAYLIPVLPLLAFAARPPHGGTYEFLVIVIGIPACLAAGALFEPRKPAIFGRLGAISYAQYALHVPLVALALGLARALGAADPKPLAPWVGFATLIALGVVCDLLDRHYDAPLRRTLTRLVQGNDPARVAKRVSAS